GRTRTYSDPHSRRARTSVACDSAFSAVLFEPAGHHPALHSFPTRRSSDLERFKAGGVSSGALGLTFGQALGATRDFPVRGYRGGDRKSTRLNSSHRTISYAVFCLKKKKHCWPSPRPR